MYIFTICTQKKEILARTLLFLKDKIGPKLLKEKSKIWAKRKKIFGQKI